MQPNCSCSAEQQQHTPTHLGSSLAGKCPSAQCQHPTNRSQLIPLVGQSASGELGVHSAALCPYLVVLRNEVVYDQHLEAKLPAQLPNILQQSLNLPLMLLLQICHLKTEQAFERQSLRHGNRLSVFCLYKVFVKQN